MACTIGCGFVRRPSNRIGLLEELLGAIHRVIHEQLTDKQWLTAGDRGFPRVSRIARKRALYRRFVLRKPGEKDSIISVSYGHCVNSWNESLPCPKKA